MVLELTRNYAMTQKELEKLKTEAWYSGWRTGFWIGIAAMLIAVFIALYIH